MESTQHDEELEEQLCEVRRAMEENERSIESLHKQVSRHALLTQGT